MSTTEQPDAMSPDAVPTVSAEQRIADLEATVADLVARLERTSEQSVERPAITTEPTGSRRNLLKLAAGAAAGGTALALGSSAGRVAADDGQALLVGEENDQGNDGDQAATVLAYVDATEPPVVNAGDPGDPTATTTGNIFTVRDATDTPGPNRSGFPAAVAGYAYSVVDHGVYGFTFMNNGYGVIGRGGGAGAVGMFAEGSRANLQLGPLGTPPGDRIDAHALGEVLVDADGDLWYCVETGSPGTWRKIAGTMTAGSFHPVTPFRAYDSRQEVADNAGLSGPSDTTVTVSEAYDVESYELVGTNVVPEGATAVSANVVAINATGGGFATVNPGGNTTVGAAALNWIDGQTIGNAGIFEISASRALTVLVRGDTNIDLTVDITGYWI